ncbi:MAG: chemotaxis protein CheW [Candidatus Omnitrophica bacterium]|nr:chemotaxis protein CheW [Candidatus Omnitrophota bacterium]
MAENNVAVIVFLIGEKRFCIDVHAVKSIIRLLPITNVPGAPKHVAGLINYKGEIIGVLDLVYLGIGEERHEPYSRIVIVELQGETFGFLVNSTQEVLTLPEETADNLRHLNLFTVGDLELTFLDLNQLLKDAALVNFFGEDGLR